MNPKLYAKATGGTADLSAAGVWFTDAACTISAGNAPWNDTSPFFLDHDLHWGTGQSGTLVDRNAGAYGTGATGTCYVGPFQLQGNINDGAWACQIDFSQASGGAAIGAGVFTGGFINFAGNVNIEGGRYIDPPIITIGAHISGNNYATVVTYAGDPGFAGATGGNDDGGIYSLGYAPSQITLNAASAANGLRSRTIQGI